MEEANVTALFKKGSQLKPSNYRPVSLTSVPCKILERIIANNIMRYLVANNILCKEQHGFMKGKSCTTNLLEYVDMITTAFLKGTPIDVLYTDFKKAFDSVSHKKLITKISGVGINGVI